MVDPELTDGLPAGKHVLFSSRSFSIFRVEEDGLTQVLDSGKAFEELTASYIPEYFNCSNDDNEHDSRSPKKGPEPESVAVGSVGNSVYAFVALERIGGIMVYDITDPVNAFYVNYINTRDFSENPEDANSEASPEFHLTGDVAPEGLYFINTPDTSVLLAAYEVSGTVSAYAVGGTVDHNFADGVCTKCSEAAPADATEPSEVPESTEPSGSFAMVCIVISALIAIVLVIVFIRKRK